MIGTQAQFSANTKQILELAKQIAKDYGLGYVGTEHLLLAIVRQGGSNSAKVLHHLGVDEYRTKELIDRLVKERMQETWVLGRVPGTPHFRDVLARAEEFTRGTGNWQVGSLHLLMALASEKGCTGFKALQEMGVTVERIRDVLKQARIQ